MHRSHTDQAMRHSYKSHNLQASSLNPGLVGATAGPQHVKIYRLALRSLVDVKPVSAFKL